MAQNENGGWGEYQKMVLDKLDGHAEQLTQIWNELRRVGESVVEVKAKASATATVISVVISAISVAIAWTVAAAKQMAGKS